MVLNAEITKRMLECIQKFAAQCKSVDSSIVVQNKWWAFPLTEYKNGILFDQVEYGFGGRLAKPDQYVVVVGQETILYSWK